MDELNLANLVEEALEIVPEVALEEGEESSLAQEDNPTVTAEFILPEKGQKDCEYRFKFTATVGKRDVKVGKLLYTLDPAFKNLTVISGDPAPAAGEWNFGPLDNAQNPPGIPSSRTVTFQVTYDGPSVASIKVLKDMIYTGEFANGPNKNFNGNVAPTEIEKPGTPCTPPFQFPTINIAVARIGETCKYKFTFTATKNGTSNITNGEVSFKLNNLFLDPVADDPIDGVFDPLGIDPIESIWKYGNLGGVGNPDSKTASFTALYTGAAGTITVLTEVTSTGNHDGGGEFIQTIDVPEKDVVKCEVPCCEGCGTCNEYTLDPCEHKVAETPIPVQIQSKGRRLTVNLDSECACSDKPINVGVLLYEVIEGLEHLYAYKVVRLGPGSDYCPSTSDKCDSRQCNCVEFEINDDAATECKQRTFRVKTKAHHVIEADPQTCSCSGRCLACRVEGAKL